MKQETSIWMEGGWVDQHIEIRVNLAKIEMEIALRLSLAILRNTLNDKEILISQPAPIPALPPMVIRYWPNQHLFKAMTSITFLKYRGAGFGEDKPPVLGQKIGIVRELEKTVKGYRMVRRELDRLRIELEKQEDARKRSKLEKPIRVQYYKSQMGIRLMI